MGSYVLLFKIHKEFIENTDSDNMGKIERRKHARAQAFDPLSYLCMDSKDNLNCSVTICYGPTIVS